MDRAVRRPFAVALALALSIPIAALGEESEDNIDADRPDYTESARVIRRGWTQLESGVEFETEHQNHSNLVSLGTPLLRFGVADRWELRLGSQGIVGERASRGEPRVFGRSDVTTGLKYAARRESAVAPALAVIGEISVPLGDDHFGSGAYEPALTLCWEKGIAAGLELSGNFGWSRPAWESGRVNHEWVTFSISRDFGGFGAYWEAYGLSGSAPGEPRTIMFDSGLSRRIGKDAQWDVSLHRRLSQFGPDWIVAVGFSIRQPLGSLSSWAARRTSH